MRFKKKKTECGLEIGSCKNCTNHIQCETCRHVDHACSPLMYYVYNCNGSRHMFCMGCLGRYLIENARPYYLGDTLVIEDVNGLKDIVRADKDIKKKK